MTHRALKREFELDEETLADLIEELITARRVARDEGKIIIWTGAEDEEASHAFSNRAPPGNSGSETDTTAPRRREILDGQRRQITIVFVDVVGSTELAEVLDPETLQQLIRRYQQVCVEIITQFDGYVAQYLGDGLLVYFGYPSAHENDAERAVRASLAILRSISDRQSDFIRPVAVRIGVHTGTVVIGEMGSGERTEYLALGGAPNTAARVQMEADPGEVLITSSTAHLIHGLFDITSVGTPDLKGISEPPELFRVENERAEQSRFDVALKSGLAPIVGRDIEMDVLRDRWSKALNGNGQIVTLCGEPGIGKSRLVQAFTSEIDQSQAAKIECRCSPYHQNSSLRPIIEHLTRFFGFDSTDDDEAKVEKIRLTLSTHKMRSESATDLLLALFGLPHADLQLNPEQQKQQTLATLLEWLLDEAKSSPVFMLVEDLHWVDPSTLDFIAMVLQQVATSQILVALTFRPEFNPNWNAFSYQSQLTLTRLRPESVSEIVARLTKGKKLPQELAEEISRKTDGIPLFVEELTKNLLESEYLTETEHGFELVEAFDAMSIPSTLHDSLMARLDRLGSARETAQLGSVIGREFSLELLMEISEISESALKANLDTLIDAELVMMQGIYPNVSFVFKHALIRDAAYQSMLRSDKQKLHQEIAESLVAKSGGTSMVQLEVIAIHFSEAGNIEKALQYWRLAGEEAIKSSANSEAVEHIRHGLALLHKLPIGTSRQGTELTLLSLLGPALIAAKGYGAMETAQCWERARELTRIVTDSPQLFPTLYGCWVYKLTWAEFPATKDMAREFLSLAERSEDSGAIVTGHRILGFSDSCLGNFAAAKDNFEYVAANYHAETHDVLAYRYGQDPYAAGVAMLGWNLWHLGLPDKALLACEGAREHAMKLNHLNTRGYVETFGMAQVLLFRGDLPALSKLLAEMETLCEKHNLVFWVGFIKVFKGWVSCHDGLPQEALTYVQSGIEHLDNTGTSMFRPLCLLIQAHVLRELGRGEESLAVIEHAIALVEQTSEQWITPELLRFKGEVLLESRLPNCESDGEELLRASLHQAKLRKAKSWELRTANTLSQVLIARGERRQATELLIPIYQQFDQGFDTKDLRESKRRIASLQ